jgi:hypothetical protein
MDLRERLQRNYRDYSDQLEHIRSDDMRSGKAKRLEIEALFEKHSGVQAELEAQYRADLDTRVSTTREKAFRPPRVGDDAALDALSYREALKDVSQTREPAELADVLQRAQTTGDKALAKAILYRAYELQNANLVGEYLQPLPRRVSEKTG